MPSFNCISTTHQKTPFLFWSHQGINCFWYENNGSRKYWAIRSFLICTIDTNYYGFTTHYGSANSFGKFTNKIWSSDFSDYKATKKYLVASKIKKGYKPVSLPFLNYPGWSNDFIAEEAIKPKAKLVIPTWTEPYSQEEHNQNLKIHYYSNLYKQTLYNMALTQQKVIQETAIIDEKQFLQVKKIVQEKENHIEEQKLISIDPRLISIFDE